MANASLNEFREIAEFARFTYWHAFGREIGFTVLSRYFADKMWLWLWLWLGKFA